MDAEELLTEREAGERIGQMKPDTMRKWRVRGRGPAYLKIGGRVFYTVADIEKFIQDSRVEPGAKKRRRRPEQLSKRRQHD